MIFGGEKPAAVIGKAREGSGLSIPVGGTVIGGGGEAWWLWRREARRREGERKRGRHFYLTVAGWSKFKEIGMDFRWRRVIVSPLQQIGVRLGAL